MTTSPLSPPEADSFPSPSLMERGGANAVSDGVRCLYIHIPFCKKKCNYCDFVSYAGKEDLIDKYVVALANEISTSPLSPPEADSFPSPSLMERGGTNAVSDGVRTIYFGGGTPTLLKPSHFESILKAVSREPLATTEITVEANPGTISYEYLKDLRALGINRISFGAQSFNDKHLQLLGRIHNSKQIFEAIEDARKAGFENISLDLIFAIPGQTLDEWKEDLKSALSLNPEHLSTYNLQIEEGTPLFERMTNGIPIGSGQMTNEDLDADMYELTIDWLTANGLRHYEISNFAKPGFECKHNINYWKMGNWLGIGSGAHSHVGGKLLENNKDLESYLANSHSRESDCHSRESGNPASGCPIKSGMTQKENSTTDQRETIFMGLRLIDGIDKSMFLGFDNQVDSLKAQGLVEENGKNIRLTHKGLMLGNLVFEKFA